MDDVPVARGDAHLLAERDRGVLLLGLELRLELRLDLRFDDLRVGDDLLGLDDGLQLGLRLDDGLRVGDRLLRLDDGLGDVLGGQVGIHDDLDLGRGRGEGIGRGGREVLVGHGGQSPWLVSGEAVRAHPKMRSTPLVKM